MKMEVTCPQCGRRFRAPAELAGKRARCKCGEVLTVPAAESGEELARKWYYAREGERYGPVPIGELRRLVERGEIQRTDYVWSRGMAAWEEAGQVEQVAAFFGESRQAREPWESAEEPAAPAEAAPQQVRPEPAPADEPATRGAEAVVAAGASGPRAGEEPKYAGVLVLAILLMAAGALCLAAVLSDLVRAGGRDLTAAAVALASGFLLVAVGVGLGIAREQARQLGVIRRLVERLEGNRGEDTAD